MNNFYTLNNSVKKILIQILSIEKVKFMTIFLTVLILIFTLQSSIKADDIRDFEIEGMSVGDSLNEHFSKKK